MGATYSGRDEIARFHRWMLKFAPDSAIKFSDFVVRPVQRTSHRLEPLTDTDARVAHSFNLA
jgi:hypothetical protein